MNFGSHGLRSPNSNCRPTRTTSGPLTAPPTPGIGMKAGRVVTNSSMPNDRLPRPANTSPSCSTSSGLPTAKASSRDRVPASARVSRSYLPGGFIVVRVFGSVAVQQQLVDARTVEVGHFDPPARPREHLTDVGDAPEVGDHHAGGGVEIVFVLPRDVVAQQFAQVLHVQRAVDEPGAVGAFHHGRVALLEALGPRRAGLHP